MARVPDKLDPLCILPSIFLNTALIRARKKSQAMDFNFTHTLSLVKGVYLARILILRNRLYRNPHFTLYNFRKFFFEKGVFDISDQSQLNKSAVEAIGIIVHRIVRHNLESPEIMEYSR